MALELDATVPATPTSPPASSSTTASVDGRAITATASATASGDGSRLRPPPPGLPAGARLAHFEIVRPLGQGGMGEVYLATDLALDRPVALKVLPTAVAGDPTRRERLLREARAQARINHPHVCHIYFIGEEHGRLFFAMEYIDGETVAARLERGPLPPDEALELARMAALGLREAQRHGFTHRDVKPSNLMIDRHGVLKVLDFGLVTVGEFAPAATGDLAATATVGTPLYMAPEQAQGAAVDLRADIYALGATLHHMLAGAPPFRGDTAADLLSQHATAHRAPLATAAARRRAVRLADELIEQMMAKRPDDRPASHDALLVALERASPVHSRPAGFWPRAFAAGLDGAIALVLAMPWMLLLGDAGAGPWLVTYALVLAPLVIARRGTTPGHALLELELVSDRDGRRLRWSQAALRTLLLTAGLWLGAVFDVAASLSGLRALTTVGTVASVAGVVLPVAELARASWRAPDRRTLWDRVAGSRVRYRGRGGAAITVNAAQVADDGASRAKPAATSPRTRAGSRTPPRS